MPRLAARVLCLTLLVLFSICAAASPGEIQWGEVRSEHFTVITDAGEKDGRDVIDHFEQMRAAFGLLFGRASINQTVPLTIVAFRNTKEFRHYSPMFQGKVVEAAGFFQQADDEDFIAVDMSRAENWEIAFHEYAHVLLNSNFQPTAPWFDEGYAEFLSSIEVSPGGIVVGQTIPGAALLLQNGALHLLDLFQVQQHSETYNVSGSRRDMFYLESWLVVHYLFDNGRMPQVSKYFHLTNDEKVPVAQALQTAFGVTPAELETQILGYLRNGKIKVTSYTGKEKFAVTYTATARPLPPLETRAELADLHLHSQDYVPLAIREFEEILRADPNQAEAQRGLGYAYLRSGNMERAGEHFRAASKLGSKDARVYYYSAVLLQREDPGAMTSPELAQDLRRAIELDPQYADAYAMLGECLVTTGKSAEGERSLRHAIELAPRNQMHRLNYALALMNEQKIDEAEALLTSVANSSDPEAADRAQQALRQIHEFKAASLNRETADDAAVREPATPQGPAPGPEPVPAPVANPLPAKYLQGTLLSVDCSAPPAALLTVVSRGKTWKMKVADRKHTVLVGAGELSCSWSKRKVALNYSPVGSDEGSVISLEIR